VSQPTVTNAADGPRKAYAIHVEGTRAGLSAYVDTDTQAHAAVRATLS